MSCCIGDFINSLPQLFILKFIFLDRQVATKKKVAIFFINDFESVFDEGCLSQKKKESEDKVWF